MLVMGGLQREWEREVCGPTGRWIPALNRCVYPDYSSESTPTPDDAIAVEAAARKGGGVKTPGSTPKPAAVVATRV